MPDQPHVTNSPETPDAELARLRVLVVEQAVRIDQRVNCWKRACPRIATTPASPPPQTPVQKSRRRARSAVFVAMPGPMIADFFTRYEALLAEGARCHPRRSGSPGSRRRDKQTPAYHLIISLQEHREAVLGFITDRRMPFDNHQAERDIHMPKLKQQGSGCFRSANGATAMPTIRPSLCTLCKQSFDIYQALVMNLQVHSPIAVLA